MKKRTITIEDISRPQEWIILCLHQRELYGKQLQERIERASGGTRKLGCGSLYPKLKELEKMGLIQSRWGDEYLEERNGARKRYYTLTFEGEQIANRIGEFYQNLKSMSLPFEAI